jgi:predicted nucleic acid-binding protein
MIIIADSSALIALASCNSLSLLDKLFCEIKVPQAVFNEVVNQNKPQAQTLKNYLVNKVTFIDPSQLMQQNLGMGEREAMTLYNQLHADLLLIDDAKAKRIAIDNDIKVIGSLGVLLLAKQKGLILKIKPHLELILENKIYLNTAIINQVLTLSGEN